MRIFLGAALLLASALAVAQDAPKPLTIALEPLGDRDGHVVARVFFRFANPRAITDAGLFLEGSFTQAGHVPRNFRFAVPRKGDKLIWHNTRKRNGKLLRHTRWSVLPDQRNEMAAVHTFAEGATEIEARLVLEGDHGNGAKVVATATETFTLAKTNKPFAADDEEPAADEPEEPAGAVTMRAPQRNATSGLFRITADVLPPVKRVEFWIDDRKIVARNAAPYTTELDLGDSPERVALRAIGYDARGGYVDADAVVVKESDALAVTLTRVVTPDGVCHFKLSVRNPKKTPLQSIALYSGDRKLHAWDRPPFAVSIPVASLAGVEVVRASVIDATGHEASDVQRLR